MSDFGQVLMGVAKHLGGRSVISTATLQKGSEKIFIWEVGQKECVVVKANVSAKKHVERYGNVLELGESQFRNWVVKYDSIMLISQNAVAAGFIPLAQHLQKTQLSLIEIPEQREAA